MLTGIDARMINNSGIGIVLQNVLRGLPHEQGKYVLFGDSAKLQGYNIPVMPADFPIYSIKEQLSFPGLLKRSKVDILFCPHYTVPLLASTKMITTINDIIHLLFPEYLPVLGSAYARFMMKAACERSKKVIAISQCTARDAVKHLGVREEKIRVIYPGVGRSFSPCADTSGIKGRYGDYLLYVGNIRPHKNIHRLIEAFSLFKRSKNTGHKLVLIGKGKDPYLSRVKQLISDSEAAGDIAMLSDVPLDELPRFYSNADLFVFPSLYEGFGLPPLEAMACGCPVMTSNSSSLPEVVGDAARMVDPCDVKAMAAAIDEVTSDTTARRQMSAKGIKRAALFTWEKTVEGYLDVFKEVCMA